jgi:uncharacterized membrane protein YkvA (DUF1232 family)
MCEEVEVRRREVRMCEREKEVRRVWKRVDWRMVVVVNWLLWLVTRAVLREKFSIGAAAGIVGLCRLS